MAVYGALRASTVLTIGGRRAKRQSKLTVKKSKAFDNGFGVMSAQSNFGRVQRENVLQRI